MQEVIVAALLDNQLDPKVAEEIAFHLSDWTENLEEISDIYNHGESMATDDIKRIVITFLAHVPNHVAAAKKLIGLGPIKDVFGVGVAEED